MAKFGEVIFKNKSWKLSWSGHHTAKEPHDIRIESMNKAFVDYAIMYHDGRVAYDWPERVPDYIKEKVRNAFMKEKRKK